MNRSRKNGFSIIELIVSITIMGFIAITFASMLVQQKREVKSLSEKMLSVEIDQSIKKLMSNSNFCSCTLRNKSFNIVTKTFTPTISNIPNSYTTVPVFPAACSFTAGDFLVPPVGNNLPGSNVTVAALTVDNVNEISPGSGQYTADLGLRYGGMVRELNNPKTKFSFTVDLTVAGVNKPFQRCLNSALASLECRTVIHQGGPPFYVSNARCNADEIALSGSGTCEVPGSPICLGLTNGVLNASTRDSDGRGWSADCTSNSSGESCSIAQAFCCKE